MRVTSEAVEGHCPDGLPWRQLLNKYLRPIVGGLSVVAMKMTAMRAQENTKDLPLEPMAPVDVK